MKVFPSIVPSSALLSGLLGAPVSVRFDQFVALVRQLNAGELPARAEIKAMEGADDDLWPWEEPLYEIENGIALVSFSGAMVKGYDAFTCWCYGLASIDRLQLTLLELAGRDDVAAVVLNIDSPGGMCLGTPELGDTIASLSAEKLVVAFTSGMACSAAYWSACGATMVLATRSAMVGSIGTVWPIYDYSEMFAEMGIKVDVFKRGTFKGMGIAGTSLTDEQKKWADDQVGRINDGFTGFVKSRRGAVADSTMQGQWFDGEQALELKLVDRVVSGLPEVVAEIRAKLDAAMSGSLR